MPKEDTFGPFLRELFHNSVRHFEKKPTNLIRNEYLTIIACMVEEETGFDVYAVPATPHLLDQSSMNAGIIVPPGATDTDINVAVTAFANAAAKCGLSLKREKIVCYYDEWFEILPLEEPDGP